METEPTDPLGAAYGDPAIVLAAASTYRTGSTRPPACEEANGVGWFAPPEQYDDQSADVTIFVDDPPAAYVELRLPADYRPDGLAAALAELADAGEARNLEKVQDCV